MCKDQTMSSAALNEMVPEMSPVVAFMLSPVGNPSALYVSGNPKPLFAEICSDTASPSVFDWSLGCVTVTAAFVTVHLNDWLAFSVPSEAVTVTEYGLPVLAELLIVPEITPVVELMESPPGKFVAE